MPVSQIEVLIAAGGGAGIAATFNTPIGGVLFAVELMLTEISDRTLVPTVLATATATTVSWSFFGNRPSFVLTSPPGGLFQGDPVLMGPVHVLLGVVMGGMSWLFIRSIYAFEDLFEGRIPRHPFLRHALGMLLVGLTMYACLRFFGHYYVQGVGYATIQDIVSGAAIPVWLLLLLCALKLLTTSLTLGSGASGGVFSPSLFMGATLGAAFGQLIQWGLPDLHLSPIAFAIGGMAGVVSGTTGAALTAMVMIYEMTLDYSVIVPMAITVAVAYGIRRALCRESIYTMKLARRGHAIPDALRTR
jgi:CIC family chloride channel protein